MLTKMNVYPKVKGKKRQVAEMLVNPENTMSVTELCRHFGISRTTFYNWQRDPDFKGLVNYLIESYTNSELANVWKSLINKASSGSTEAIKLYFEMKNMYKQQIDLNGGVVFISGEEELLE